MCSGRHSRVVRSAGLAWPERLTAGACRSSLDQGRASPSGAIRDLCVVNWVRSLAGSGPGPLPTGMDRAVCRGTIPAARSGAGQPLADSPRTMRPLASTMILLSALALARPMMAQEATHQAERSEQAVLTPGDSVRVQVWRRPEFSGDFVIAPDGSITHPLYRTVRVGGVPFATAEANIRRFLSGFEENPQFVMEPLIRVAISGEVTRPSVFATRPETTIGEAVARAGGATQNGARNRVRIIRFTQSGVQQVF